MFKNDNFENTEAQVQYDLSEFHEYVRERSETARAEVSDWNARVEKWRDLYGDKPLPPSAWEKHPAAAMLAGIFEHSGLVDHKGALSLAVKLLPGSNYELRRMEIEVPQHVAQLLDYAPHRSNPEKSTAEALMLGRMGIVAGLLVEWRTTEDVCGLPANNVPTCILARTADVREGGDDA